MTDIEKRLEEIEERFRRGTEGLDEEWVVSDSEVVSVTLKSDIMAAVCEVGPEDEEGVMERAELFANVRTDIPWLLKRVRELQEQVLRAYETGWMECADRAIKICERRAKPEDVSFAIRAEANKCGLAIEHYCVTDTDAWNQKGRAND